MFLFASQSETQGIVLLEAMAAGLPVVAVHASGVCDVVKDGINGYMTGMDVNEWEEKIEQILDIQSIKEKMKQNAILEAKGYLSINIAKTVVEYYSNLLLDKGKDEKYEKKIV